MLVPLSWLCDFAPFDLEPKALAEVLDNLGMVVEGVTVIGEGLSDVVAARVLIIEAIPGADRIRKIIVDAGGEPKQIVCGAWNFGEGDTVPLAPVGTVLPGDFQIGRRTMKGVVSDGMLCSARLGLGDDAAGLLVLPPDTPPGEPVMQTLGITPDVVYDLAIEGNRPDANCIVGVARDAAAHLRIPFSLPEPPPLVAVGEPEFTVAVSAPDLCDRFTATVMTGISVMPSPAVIARRLTLAGMRPISNVVDASNYVMLELGQPTHAYDLERLPGPVLGARAATEGETMLTLDDVERTLGQGSHPDCMITDSEDHAIGIAGIMGGASSEVHDGTTQIVLEAAHFVPMAIARTSKRIGLRSEASARFERGVDVDATLRSVCRFAELLRQTCPDLAARPTVDWRTEESTQRPTITVREARVNGILGTSLRAAGMERLLTPIGFAVAPDAVGLQVIPPSFRPDVTTEIEVIEEIARHHGYRNVTRTTVRPVQVGALTAEQRARRLLRETLVGAGLSEAMTSPLLGPGDHEKAGLAEGGIRAVDPLVKEESILRTSLLPGLLRAAAFNAERRVADVAMFEIGKVWPGVADPASDRGLPLEQHMLAVIVVDPGGAVSAVTVLRRVAAALGIPEPALNAAATPGLHPTRTAAVDGLGWVGEVDPDVAAGWGITERAGWLQVDLTALLALRAEGVAARPVSRFPSSDVDLAFVVRDAVPAAVVRGTLTSAAGDLLEGVDLFDVYRGPGVPDGARSLAFRLRFVAQDRTLTDAEVGEVRARCIAAVERHGATLRS